MKTFFARLVSSFCVMMALGCANGGFSPGYCDLIGSRQTPYGGGTGTASNPYIICTATQLNNIGLRSQDWGSNFILQNNIDLSIYTGSQFNMIGSGLFGGGGTPFTGTFNGNNLSISNFTYVASAAANIGLFSSLGGAAIIENLTLINPSVNAVANSYSGILVGFDDQMQGATLLNISILGGSMSGGSAVGGVAGEFSGTATNVTYAGTVLGSSYVGGIVGSFNGSTTALANILSSGTVTGTQYVGGVIGETFGGNLVNSSSTATVSEAGFGYTGGLIGFAQGGITGCHYSGTVTGTIVVGGLAGSDAGTVVSNSYAAGTVTGTSGGNGRVGGIAGVMTGITVTNSSFSGAVTSGGTRAGGIAASINATSISNSFTTGSVSAASQVGGIAGYISAGGAGTGIYNSYSQSSVTVSGSTVGGLVGTILAAASPDVQNSYATGLVTGVGSTGGITGQDSGSGIYAYTYFNSTVNPTLSGVGGGAGSQTAQNGVNVTGENTVAMITPATFSHWSLLIWTIVNGSYPALVWQ